jgi:hypothetical protein
VEERGWYMEWMGQSREWVGGTRRGRSKRFFQSKEVKEKEKTKMDTEHPMYHGFYQAFSWALCPIFSNGKLISSSVHLFC